MVFESFWLVQIGFAPWFGCSSRNVLDLRGLTYERPILVFGLATPCPHFSMGQKGKFLSGRETGFF